MHITFSRVIGLLVAVFVSIPLSSEGAFAQDWQAGVAKVKITPKKLMWMSGYGGRDHPAEGTLHDLWAKALVLQDPKGERAVVLTMDLVGIDRELSHAVCAALKEKHQLERRQIFLNCSHTHTGPVVHTNLSSMYFYDAAQEKLVEEYAVDLQQNLINVVGDALKEVAPARLAWGNGHATFAVNRRTNKEPDVPRLRAEGLLKGPVDHDVPVLSVTRPDGKLAAVLFGYACHTTVLSFYQWSGDYAGFTQIELEKSHPGAVAMFFAGCGADQNPLPRRTVELAEAYGRALAEAVDAVLARNMNTISGRLSTAYREIAAPLAPLPTREQIEQDTKAKDKFIASRARMLLKQIDGGKPLSPTYPYPVQFWRLGSELQLVTLGGEVVVDFSLRIKKELGPSKTWVAGYSNDVMAYIPSLRVLKEGGYEGGGAMIYYGLPTVWGPEIEESIVKGVHQLAAESADNKP